MAHVANDDRVAGGAVEDEVAVRSRDLEKDASLIGNGAEAGECLELRNGQLDRRTNRGGGRDVIAGDVRKNFLNLNASRRGVATPHAPWRANVASTSASEAKRPRRRRRAPLRARASRS